MKEVIAPNNSNLLLSSISHHNPYTSSPSRTMDDDITWGSSVWASSDPVVLDPSSTKPRPPSIQVPPPPTPFDDGAGFDDFDDFGVPAEAAQDGTLKDDEFGDFEDFEEGTVQPVSSFPDVDSFATAGPSSQRSWQPLQVDPLPPRQELRDEINDILGPIWKGEDISRITTDDPMREVEGVSQILITSSR